MERDRPLGVERDRPLGVERDRPLGVEMDRPLGVERDRPLRRPANSCPAIGGGPTAPGGTRGRRIEDGERRSP